MEGIWSLIACQSFLEILRSLLQILFGANNIEDIASRERKYLHRWSNSFLGNLQCQHYLEGEILECRWKKQKRKIHPSLPERTNVNILLRKGTKKKYILQCQHCPGGEMLRYLWEKSRKEKYILSANTA